MRSEIIPIIITYTWCSRLFSLLLLSGSRKITCSSSKGIHPFQQPFLGLPILSLLTDLYCQTSSGKVASVILFRWENHLSLFAAIQSWKLNMFNSLKFFNIESISSYAAWVPVFIDRIIQTIIHRLAQATLHWKT